MTSTDPDMAPGDEVPPDTPNAGPVPCEHCQGRGEHDDGAACPECDGTGEVIAAVGGG